MAIPNMLIATTNQSGPVQLAQLIGGTSVVPIGGVTGVDSNEPVVQANKDITNKVVGYRQNLFVAYASGGGGILRVYRLSLPGLVWSSVFSLNTFVNGPRTLGIFNVHTGTTARIAAIFYASNGNNFYIAYSDSGGAFTSSGSVLLEGGGVGGRTIQFNNKIYQLAADGGTERCREFDPVAVNATSFACPWGGANLSSDPGGFVVYDDRLFCINLTGLSLGDLRLYEFTGAGWSLLTNIADNFWNSTAFAIGCFTGFTDPGTGDLIIMGPGADSTSVSGNAGLVCYRLTPSGGNFTVQDITTTVIPASIAPGGRAGTDPCQDRVVPIVTTGTPGSTEVYVGLQQGPAPAAATTIYAWNGVASAMTSLGAGPSTIYAIPDTPFGGGDRIFRDIANQAVIEYGQADPGGFTVFYRVYGTQPSQNVTLWYNLRQETPDVQAVTLVAQTGGSGISGSMVTGITGDDGATLFSLRWDAEFDGVSIPDIAHMFLDINP